MLHHRLLCLLLIMAACLPSIAGADPPELQRIELKTMQVGTNLIADPGFEAPAVRGIPPGWSWDRRNTDATCTLDSSAPHRGRQALHLTNSTVFGANIYAMLVHTEPFALVPGRHYVLSAWYRKSGQGIAWVGGGSGWQYRLQAPDTRGKWRRASLTFVAAPDDAHFMLRIGTESPTSGVWIDDIKLEEGDTPTPDAASDPNAGPELYPEQPETEINGDGAFTVPFLFYTPQTVHGSFAASMASATASGDAVDLTPGAREVLIHGIANSTDDHPHTLTVAFGGLKSTTQLRFFSASSAHARAAALRNALPAYRARLNALAAHGADTSYPEITLSLLERFVDYVDADADHNEAHRAIRQLDEMEVMLANLKASLASASHAPKITRWTGAERPVVRSGSFIGKVTGGTTRPIFFTGYGHFGQVVADIEHMPHFGANIIQIEVGPNALYPSEGNFDSGPIDRLKSILARAQKAGVAVCLLISPHYMPDWMLVKYPEMRVRREGFLQYCIHAPAGRAFLKKFVTALITPIRNEPALQSICLSNEPTNMEAPCPTATAEWHQWLDDHHGGVELLNAQWHTKYGSLEEIPLPDPFSPPPTGSLLMDYTRFNQDEFAAWHAMLAEAVHAVAPNLPVHAKAMTWTMESGQDVRYGVDATLFSQATDINGNDSVNFYAYGLGDFAQGWQRNLMAGDLQRSVHDAPNFNSENHIIEDRGSQSVPPEQVYASLWQDAIHGQCATTVWVWERSYDPNSDTYGSILHRPICAEALGRANYDLNRAAVEVTALQSAPAQVAILQSVTASVWDTSAYTDCLDKLYTALCLRGIKVGFVTERQLEQDLPINAPVLLVPAAAHLSDLAYGHLLRYKGRIVGLGPGCLTRNEYDAPRTMMHHQDMLSYAYGKTDWKQLHASLGTALPAWNVRPEIAARTISGPIGVAWRCAVEKDRTLINLCNYANSPVTIELQRSARPVTPRDVLTGATVTGHITLKPLETRLLKIRTAR